MPPKPSLTKAKRPPTSLTLLTLLIKRLFFEYQLTYQENRESSFDRVSAGIIIPSKLLL